MCNIFFTTCDNDFARDNKLLQRISNRGPDCIHSISYKISDTLSLTFCGAVLWTQGSKPTVQPVENDKAILLFNGDVYNHHWDKNISDTQTLMRKFNDCNSSQDVINVIHSLKGPFSIIYFEKTLKILYFTRDRLGRVSLLLHRSKKSITISSVLGRKYPCIEIPAFNIYKLDIENGIISQFSWDCQSFESYNLDDWIQMIQNQQDLPDEENIFSVEDTFDLRDDVHIVDYINEVSGAKKCKQVILKTLLSHETIGKVVETLLHLLEKSIKTRIETQPNKCKDCLSKKGECKHCAVGILFSGGIDCTILARLADKYVPISQPIDLINVAFKTESVSYEVPDRITGRQSYNELRSVCPSRQWVFREVNVDKKDLELCQSAIIADLVYPRRTILDESLGSALWYAAGAQHSNDVSPCRILLLGSGADELFGGYSRHRNAFKRKGWPGLAAELTLDWNRISYRNLARDNRVICDHGRIPRLPYLDEEFSTYVLNLKPWLKCFPTENLGIGVGDKLMLRLLAMHLGLTDVALLPKRALQFGSRIANKKEKGKDISKHMQ
ncbi:unnamed protein product [Leptosia nina]|uniref:Asparagine synthetase domain-containing protein 1 n=1 Tax=Leptosia nina TaxID=320188 RepID=A0AAV1J542_9NEOP